MVSTSHLARFAGSGDRPGERGVEEDVGFEKRAGRVVDEEAGGRQHAIERRLVEKPERRHVRRLLPGGSR